MGTTRRRIVVRGMVQGVGYRWSMAREAGRRGARGWVRNREDGAVEAVVEGDEETVDALVAWARRGPAGAAVSDVAVDEAPPGPLGPFEIRA
ncbi:acylphosphatase [Cellulomonas sp.]|uniref:acylphosphatase n=1 Tax=Cellulomonas sp. TaxID=40001 RepID=UPI001B2E59C2|nr:acylphosphatase [Cellulomonas sp.]MBO9554740.1 acylphosphatase [Cellulomonas sp.]